MLRFFTVPRLALNSNLIFEIGSNREQHHVETNDLSKFVYQSNDLYISIVYEYFNM